MKYSRYTLISLIILGVLGIAFKYHTLNVQEKEKTASLATIYAKRFANELNSIILETDVIEDIILVNNGNLQSEQYENLASLIYNQDNFINVAFLPNGIVEYAYPPEINKLSIGHNVLEDDITSVDAIKAKQTNESIFSGPYMLRQGMEAVILRNPVYYNNNGEEVFWGFVAVAITPNTLVQKTGINDLKDFGYEVNVKSTFQDHTRVFYKSTNFKEEEIGNSHTIDTAQGRWHFSIYNKDFLTNTFKYLSLYSIAIFFFAALIYFIVRYYEDRKNSIFEQSFIDKLTSLKNQKALTEYALNSDIWKRKGFTLFYIDIDKLKFINEKYGHEVGDKLLTSYAKRLKEEFTDDTLLIRIREDEFIVIISRTLDEYSCMQVQNLILNMSEETFFINTKHINISVSIGYATYPRDGKNFNEIMSKADESMYYFKELAK